MLFTIVFHDFYNRYGSLIHAETKKELLALNAGDKEKELLVEKITTPFFEFLPQMSQQRFIKTHIPFSLMPPSVMEQQSMVIYVARNPRDVAVSYYHLSRLYLTMDFHGSFADYWHYFENNLVRWCPYWTHIKEGWAHRNHPNVLFMFYEDLIKDLPGAIRNVAKFMDKTVNEDQVARLAEHLNIRNFKNNPSVNCEELKRIKLLKSGEQGFVRLGKTDGWSDEYSPELKERVLKWIEDNSKDLGFKFPVEY